MRKLFPILLFFSGISLAFGQPGPDYACIVDYFYQLNFSPISGTEVIPYYASLEENIREESTSIEISIMGDSMLSKEYWFEYAPAILPYLNLPDSGINISIPLAHSGLNVSKIRNSKGKTAYIYIHQVLGFSEDQVKQNPCFAFEAMEQDSTWDTRQLQLKSTVVTGYDLEEGTYLFNWYDKCDPLNWQLKKLWKLNDQYAPRIQNLKFRRDSAEALWKLTRQNENIDFSILDDLSSSQKQKDSIMALFDQSQQKIRKQELEQITLDLAASQKELEEKKSIVLTRIHSLGYGTDTFFQQSEKQAFFTFEIQNQALISNQLSKVPISPEELQKYIQQPHLKRPKAIKKVLEVFAHD